MGRGLGSRLPDPYWDKVQDRATGYRTKRKCKCGWEWVTVEVPVVYEWKGGLACNCPNHPETMGKTLSQLSVAATRTGHYSSAGLLRVASMGGVYRRRQCPIKGCVDPKGKRSRWTTGEFASDGTICADVMECPRCGGKGMRRRIR